jgi:hypothetical protein
MYCENHTKHMHIICGKRVEVLYGGASGTYRTIAM